MLGVASHRAQERDQAKEDHMATSDVTTHLLDTVERLQSLIKEHAASAETNRQLASTVYDAMLPKRMEGSSCTL